MIQAQKSTWKFSVKFLERKEKKWSGVFLSFAMIFHMNENLCVTLENWHSSSLTIYSYVYAHYRVFLHQRKFPCQQITKAHIYPPQCRIVTISYILLSINHLRIVNTKHFPTHHYYGEIHISIYIANLEHSSIGRWQRYSRINYSQLR